MLFDTLETVVSLMRRAVTSTGLTTTVNVIRRAYETGRNATEEMKQKLQIVYDDLSAKMELHSSAGNATVILWPMLSIRFSREPQANAKRLICQETSA